MNVGEIGSPASGKPLRILPGVVLAVLLVLVRVTVPVVSPDNAVFGMIGAALMAVGVVLWWMLLSRAPWVDRVGVLAFAVLAMIAANYTIIHRSIQNGAMNRLYYLLALPTVALGLVISAVLTRRLSAPARRAGMAAGILLGCGVWALGRTDGIKGSGGGQFAWRWTKSHEELLLEQSRNEPLPVPPAPVKSEPVAPVQTVAVRSAVVPAVTAPVKPEHMAEWPGFRGALRDGVVRGVQINTDWSSAPPKELWRRPIGPGWSSFAVDGDLLYTQEQRGQDEIVACHNVRTGQPVWIHRDAARFWESNGGAGPRGTPTLYNGRVYTFGATGILNALDAATGAVAWSRNAATETKAATPVWGFASSPVVVDDAVIIAVSGRLAAYDLATGKQRWVTPTGAGSYSSPHLLTVDGVQQIALMSGIGATSVSPSDGKVLWKHSWPGSTIIQPAVTPDGDIVISVGDAMGGLGVRLLKVARSGGTWTVEERWTSKGLKPYFNDLVVHKGHVYGFDGHILSCIALEDGQRKWKGGRYGSGQLVLLPDQDLLLVLSEEGELALVRATPDEFQEVARHKAIEGKTWNHPVLVRDVVLARNGEEMAAFRLAQR